MTESIIQQAINKNKNLIYDAIFNSKDELFIRFTASKETFVDATILALNKYYFDSFIRIAIESYDEREALLTLKLILNLSAKDET